MLQRATRAAENLSTRSTADSQTEQYLQQYTEVHDDLQAGQDSQQYTEGLNGSPQAEQQHSHHVVQDNSIFEAYKRPESQAAVHAVTLNSMEDLQHEN